MTDVVYQQPFSEANESGYQTKSVSKASGLKIWVKPIVSFIQHRTYCGRPGSIPFALITATAAGEVRNLIKAWAASGSLAPVLTPAVILI